MDGSGTSAGGGRPPDRPPWDGLPPEDHDTPAEVDATFRTQRRIAVGYFLLFFAVTIAVPALTLVLDWWSTGRVFGAMSPNFVMAAVGLYVFFFLLAVAASSLASAVEDRMLGGQGWPSFRLDDDPAATDPAAPDPAGRDPDEEGRPR